MTFAPVSTDPFEHYFYQRAELADTIAASGSMADAYMLATASLDALAEIWLDDFPDIKQKLERELGGRIPSSIRLARLLKQFASSDPLVNKVAVVCFAEDWKHNCPKEAHIADQLLSKRISNHSDEFLRARESPKSYLDVSRDELTHECPELKSRPDLFSLAEEYEYGALLYTFYRCPLVHFSTYSERTHGFARREEVMYWRSRGGKVSIGFGINLITRWLRSVTSCYVQNCYQEGIIAASNLNAESSQEKRLESRWSRVK